MINHKAVIVAGGRGERLRPLTNDVPKPMIEIVGKPLLQYQIEWLKFYGIKDILITTCYLPEKIQEYFGDGKKFGVNIIYFTENEPLGTSGALKENAEFFNESFVVLYGDILTNLSLISLIDFHKKNNALGTIVLHEKKKEEPSSSIVDINSDNSVIEFKEKPTKEDIDKIKTDSKFVNAGIYFLDKDVLNFIPEGKSDFAHDIFPNILKTKNQLFGFPINGFYWREIGNIERYQIVKEEVENGVAKFNTLDKAVFLDRDGVINEKPKWGDYIKSPSEFSFLPGAKDSIKKLKNMGYLVFIITNQACVNKKIMKENDLNRMHEAVFNDVPIDGIYFCPHTYEEGCDCRKPKPGLVLKGMKEHNLEPEKCWVIGDNDIDIVCGNEAKCKTILIGNEGIQKLEMHPDFEVKDFVEAVKVIGDNNATS